MDNLRDLEKELTRKNEWLDLNLSASNEELQDLGLEILDECSEVVNGKLNYARNIFIDEKDIEQVRRSCEDAENLRNVIKKDIEEKKLFEGVEFIDSYETKNNLDNNFWDEIEFVDEQVVKGEKEPKMVKSKKKSIFKKFVDDVVYTIDMFVDGLKRRHAANIKEREEIKANKDRIKLEKKEKREAKKLERKRIKEQRKVDRKNKKAKEKLSKGFLKILAKVKKNRSRKEKIEAKELKRTKQLEIKELKKSNRKKKFNDFKESISSIFNDFVVEEYGSYSDIKSEEEVIEEVEIKKEEVKVVRPVTFISPRQASLGQIEILKSLLENKEIVIDEKKDNFYATVVANEYEKYNRVVIENDDSITTINIENATVKRYSSELEYINKIIVPIINRCRTVGTKIEKQWLANEIDNNVYEAKKAYILKTYNMYVDYVYKYNEKITKSKTLSNR